MSSVKGGNVKSEVNPFSLLPKAVYVREVVDAGEGAVCPHCGAIGRYVTRFMCVGNIPRAAMSGCFKLWPKHPYAARAQAILSKDRAARVKDPERKMPAWDVQVMEAIEAFGKGDLTERQADVLIDKAEDAKRRWMAGRGYTRR